VATANPASPSAATVNNAPVIVANGSPQHQASSDAPVTPDGPASPTNQQQQQRPTSPWQSVITEGWYVERPGGEEMGGGGESLPAANPARY
jgi:hypothetical protein